MVERQQNPDQTFKKRMRGLLRDVSFGIAESKTLPLLRASELHKTMGLLKALRAKDAWPLEYKRTEIIPDPFGYGSTEKIRSVYLAKPGESGEFELTREGIELPPHPSQFVSAAEQFISGTPEEDIRKAIVGAAEARSNEEFTAAIEHVREALQPSVERAQQLKDADEIFKIVNAIYSSGLGAWPDKSMNFQTKLRPDGTPEIGGDGRAREVPRRLYLVKKGADGQLEFSPEPIEMPKRPAGFINALEAFINSKPWHEVKALLPSSSGLTEAERAKVEELQNQANEAGSFDDAGRMAAKIHEQLSNSKAQTQAMRVLHRRIEQLLEDGTRDLTKLKQIDPLRTELRRFAASENGQYFVSMMFFDFLDAAALRIGRQMIAAAHSPNELQEALEAIHGHDFRYAEAYTAPFAESREDALSKIDFLDQLREIQSPTDLDALKKNVEAFEFKSSEMASQYRTQVVNFIERKREVYWPKRRRKSMPKP